MDPKITLFILLMGLVPMIVYTAIFWWLDHWEREPVPLIASCFLWGAVPSVVLVLMSANSVQNILLSVDVFHLDDPQDINFIGYSIVAPLTEEIAKGLGLLLLVMLFRREIDSLFDGILYGAVIGFGFAAVENVFYFINFSKDKDIPLEALIFMRAYLFGLNHAFFTSLTGLGFALARFQKNILLKLFFPVVGLAMAMVCHGTHNYLVGMGRSGFLAIFVDWFGIFWVFVIVVWSLGRQGRLIRRYLADEVTSGVLTAAQARLASSFWHRMMCGFGLFGRGISNRKNSHRLDQLSAELAFKKHQLATMGDEGGNQEHVADLREKLSAISRQLS